MAKGLLERFLRDAGLSEKIKVDSAGTGGYTGIAASENTVKVMEEESLDVSVHSGKGLTDELLRRSDLIFVMERTHKNIIVNQFHIMGERIRLLKEDEDITDPMGRSLEEYRRIKNIIKDQIENIFLELFKKDM